mmetsp:Transcript_14708/g.37784  ORF Transcript_14708/g.37784 Transcript_14708/m.37784 type:complete len:247 (-) Transcript_14708:107-847(-)
MASPECSPPFQSSRQQDAFPHFHVHASSEPAPESAPFKGSQTHCCDAALAAHSSSVTGLDSPPQARQRAARAGGVAAITTGPDPPDAGTTHKSEPSAVPQGCSCSVSAPVAARHRPDVLRSRMWAGAGGSGDKHCPLPLRRMKVLTDSGGRVVVSTPPETFTWATTSVDRKTSVRTWSAQPPTTGRLATCTVDGPVPALTAKTRVLPFGSVATTTSPDSRAAVRRTAPRWSTRDAGTRKAENCLSA